MAARRPALLVLLFASLAVGSAHAQDAHYWSTQFGPRSSLLGGAVIGSAEDITATYYNPGALAVARDPSFALSASVLENNSVTLEDGAGAGIDLSSSRTAFRPSLVAGTVNWRPLGADVLAYSVLTRMRGSLDINGQVLLGPDGVPPGQGLDHVAALARLDGQYSDVWGGLTWARRLGERIGLGLTWYGAVRSQDRRRESLIQTVDQDGTGTLAGEIASGQYWAARTLLKLGAHATAGPVTAGVSVTTPSLHVAGSGEVGAWRGAVSPDASELAATIQTDLDAEYRSPPSVGLGLAWRVGEGRIHASAEWFDAVDRYTVVRGASFTGQTSGETFAIEVSDARDAVVNWAVGYEHSLGPRTRVYAAYNTDRSSRSGGRQTSDLALSSFDIDAVNLGAEFRVGSVDLTVGAGASWGSDDAPELASLLGGDAAPEDARLVYREFRFLIGFSTGRGR